MEPSAHVSEHEILTTRKLPYPRARIFAAFADSQSLARWWGPAGFTNAIHAFDFKVDGDWRLDMIGPDGKRYPNHSVFQTIVPHERLVLRHVSAPPFVLQVTLADIDDGTLLTWRQVFATQELRDNIARYAVKANEENLDRLAAEVARREQLELDALAKP